MSAKLREIDATKLVENCKFVNRPVSKTRRKPIAGRDGVRG